MSRIGKKLILLPKDVEVKFFSDEDQNTSHIEITGSHGTISQLIPDGIQISLTDDRKLKVETTRESRELKSLYGTVRTVVANTLRGVSSPFIKTLNLQGVGYRAQVRNNELVLSLGFSHEVNFSIPEEITVKVDKNTTITISGTKIELVGLFASKIRNLRPPEPYNGKGVLYAGEILRRKAGKVGK